MAGDRHAHRSPFGALNINKPPGLTSRQVVDRIAKLVKPVKAGHAGTLDPMATGVLVVGVGQATRLISLVQQQPKEYRAKFLLGRRSDTDDVTGEVVETPDMPPVAREQVEALLPRFVGRIEQVPPQFSAVHVGGERAYKLAREGERVEIQPRTVEVYRIELTGFAFPEIELEIECGSGTYVRSIGRDLGELLGCGAVMRELVRTRVGPFRIEETIDIERFDRETLAESLLPATKLVEHLPRYVCGPDELTAIEHGRAFRCSPDAAFRDGETVAVLTPDSRLACLAHYRQTDHTLAPKQVFPPPAQTPHDSTTAPRTSRRKTRQKDC